MLSVPEQARQANLYMAPRKLATFEMRLATESTATCLLPASVGLRGLDFHLVVQRLCIALGLIAELIPQRTMNVHMIQVKGRASGTQVDPLPALFSTHCLHSILHSISSASPGTAVLGMSRQFNFGKTLDIPGRL